MRHPIVVLVLVVSIGLAVPLIPAADTSSLEIAARYILEAVTAFRTVYSKAIVEQADKVGVKPSEHWATEPHAIMLPAQFIKSAGAEIRGFELGLIGLTPIYKTNLPNTQAEGDALKR